MTRTEKTLRSPLTAALLLLVLGYILTINVYSDDLPSWLIAWGATPGYVILGMWAIIFFYHNSKNPTRRIRFFYTLPLEFREEDEGLQWVTYRACRKLYIFISWAIPLALVLISIFQELSYLPILVITSLGVIPCLIYWFELRSWQHKSQIEKD